MAEWRTLVPRDALAAGALGRDEILARPRKA